MIKIENTEVFGWEAAIRGMRNPKNSWDKSDSSIISWDGVNRAFIGPEDYALMKKLVKAGTDHRKYLRMLTVYVDITAPLYWWKEFDTYKVGTVANSCSTMHKIQAKEFTLEDFSCEHLISDWIKDNNDSFLYLDSDTQEPITEEGIKLQDYDIYSPSDVMSLVVMALNVNRAAYLKTNNKNFWWQMIQLLPSSYNQKRTVMMSYEVLANIYKSRNSHKQDEWNVDCAGSLCEWIKSLPYSELIVGEGNNGKSEW